jgi:proteasome alpha subunit
VGATPADDELYRITYDGSVQDEPGVVAMGGQAESMSGGLRSRHRDDLSLAEALKLAVDALGSVGGENGQPRKLAANQLEVAVLDRRRAGRTFRRLTGLALSKLLETEAPATEAAAEEATATEAAADEAVATTEAAPEASGGDQPQPPAAPGTPADNASGQVPPPSDDE